MKCSGSYSGLFFPTYSRHKRAPRLSDYTCIDAEFNSALSVSSVNVGQSGVW